MPRDFHLDTDLYFDQQRENARSSILPFVDRARARVGEGLRVLEIGCGAGGVLAAFAERGARVTGVDLHAPSIDVRAAALRGGARTRRRPASRRPTSTTSTRRTWTGRSTSCC